MKMRKILAVLAAALMLCSIIPMGAISVSAADAVYSEDFEDGTLGTWSSSSGGAANLVAAADLPVANPNGGNYAMQTIVESGQYPYLADSTSFAVEANTDYMIKVDVLHTTNNWPVEVIIGGTSWLSDTVFKSGQVNVSNTAWTTLTYIFNSGSKTNVYMGVKSSYASATVYFDNISVTKADAASVGTSDGYIYNGDFETGSTAPWSMGTNADVVADPTGSDRGYVMQSDETGSGATLFSQVANNLKANTYYKLSFKVYCYNTATNNAFWVRFPKTVTDWSINVGSSGMTTQSANDYTPRINVLGKTGAWYDLSITFNTGDLTSVLINFMNYRANYGQYYFDNIKIREVLDPSFDGYITNGNFDCGELTGWDTANGSLVEDGTGYIFQGADGGAKYSSFLKQTVTVEANTEYAISFRSKLVAGDTLGQCRVYVKSADGSTNLNSQYSFTNVTADAWVSNTITFNSGENTSVLINPQQGTASGAGVYYDDFLMWEVKDPSFDGYLYNGDFETGTHTSWSKHQSTAVDAESAYEGTFGAHLQGASAGWGGVLNQDIVNLEVGIEYNITFWYKAVQQGVNFKLKGSTSTTTFAYDYLSETEWTQVSADFTADDTEALLNFACSGIDETKSSYVAGIDEVYVDSIVITRITPEHTCEFVGEQTKDPTCTEEGEMTYSCTCGEGTYTEAIPALGHTAGAEADCVNAQTCTVCGAELNAALGHNYVGEQTQAPTCGDAGVMTYTCSNCGDSYTEAIAATGEHSYFYPCDIVCQVCYQETNPDATHNIVAVDAVEATCTANGNIAYWYCSDCGAAWADEALTQMTNQMSVIVPAAGHQYFYPCDVVCMVCYEETNPDATHNLVHVEAVAPTCTALGNVEYWYCSDCGAAWTDEACTQMTNQMAVKLPMAEHEYFYPCDPVCMNCYEITNPDAAHTIVAVEAVEATCTANGNIAYWYCSDCGAAWADEALTQMTNQMSVVVPAAHTYADNCDMDCDVCGEWRDAPHNLTTHVEEVIPANCQEEGCSEYWICEDCGGCFQDNGWGGYSEVNPAWLYYTGEHVRPEGAAACAVVACELCGEDSYGSESCVRPEGDPVCQDSTCVNCGSTVWGWGCNYNTGDEETPLPLCQAGTCVYCGTEYEYLYECENGAWAPCQDGECSYGCGKQYPATANHTLEDCTIDGNCSVCWSYVPAGEHTYADDFDVDCDVCGAIREINLPIVEAGKSISEDVSGLAVKLDVNVDGLAVAVDTTNVADYTAATVNGYKLITMGAVASNGVSTVDIPCVYLLDLEADAATFAVRVKNIPADKLDVEIIFTPYVIVEIDGEQVTINCEEIVASYNGVQG